MDDGRWTMDDGRWTMDDGRLVNIVHRPSSRFTFHASSVIIPPEINKRPDGRSMTMTRILFGGLLGFVGLLYLWLAFQSVAHLGADNWVSYLGALLFLGAGVGAVFAGINLVRTKR